MLELAEKHAKDPVAVDALIWVVQQSGQGPQANQALEQLTKNHVRDDNLRGACLGLINARWTTVPEKFLRAVLAENPHANMKGYATFGLARILQRKVQMAEFVQSAGDSNNPPARTVELYGAEFFRQGLPDRAQGIL